jgi:hypothetical protein
VEVTALVLGVDEVDGLGLGLAEDVEEEDGAEDEGGGGGGAIDAVVVGAGGK